MLSPKPALIDPAWPLEKRIWWALECISNQCDGAFKLDGVGYSKYDRPIADRLQGLELARWTDKDIDEGTHLVRKYTKQLEKMGIRLADVIGDYGAVVTLDEGELDKIKKSMDRVTRPMPVTREQVREEIAQYANEDTTSDMVSNSDSRAIVDGQETDRVASDEISNPIEVSEPFKKPKVNLVVDGTGADLYQEFLTGAAGTGKTFEMRRRIADDPYYALLTATTGIAAINLGTITINSALGYFNTESLEDAMTKGWLEWKIRELIENGYKNIAIDEISMLNYRQLDMINEAVRRVNERSEWHDKGKLGVILTGDFCQLPPIPDKEGPSKDSRDKCPWAFLADCWPGYEANTTRLTKCWRQSDQKFLDALNLIRKGNGRDGARLLKDIGITFSPSLDRQFDGTTIIAKNKGVDDFNFIAHSRVTGQMIRVKSERWGKGKKEWDDIPTELSLKIGAYVMILVNDSPYFTYVNGDCGHVGDFQEGAFDIKLVRNESQVAINPVTRFNHQKDAPRELGEDSRQLRQAYMYDPETDDIPKSPCWDIKARKWIVGAITYYPLRLAYASTVHKSQGLTLDRVQIELYNHFMSAPAMGYVSLSRARTPEGLRLVGTPEMLAEKVKVHPEVIKWL